MYVFIGRKPASTRNEVLGIAVDISQKHTANDDGMRSMAGVVRMYVFIGYFIKVKENADGRKIITYSGRST